MNTTVQQILNLLLYKCEMNTIKKYYQTGQSFMKFIRFFAVFAVVVTLLIAFNGRSQAQYRYNWQNDRNTCVVRKWDRQQPQDVFPALPKNSVLNIKTTHVAVITRTQEEFNYEQRAYENAGFTSWLPVVSIDVPATYCGKPVQLKADVLLTEDYQTTPSFIELFEIVGSERSFFSDYYDIHGSSLLYYGLEAAPGVSYEQVLAFLQEQNIPIVFHTEALGAVLDFIRIGYGYAEIVTPQAMTN